ncbi:unnamed protein product [Heligmosomoides polygyrus]|uniref:Uncharacterized protein n=1 Tax=Heligmosomoides polygyrus TaxID=6339 RepID=A0A183FVG3_HELPZ|nr:unnamed protein product [Heligmosomoides polygyrus]
MSTNPIHGNSQFQKPRSLRWTWKSPGGQFHNEIDHIIFKRKYCLTDVSVVPKFYTGSDHGLRAREEHEAPRKYEVVRSRVNFGATETSVRQYLRLKMMWLISLWNWPPGDSQFHRRKGGFWNCESPWMVLVDMMNSDSLYLARSTPNRGSSSEVPPATFVALHNE